METAKPFAGIILFCIGPPVRNVFAKQLCAYVCDVHLLVDVSTQGYLCKYVYTFLILFESQEHSFFFFFRTTHCKTHLSLASPRSGGDGTSRNSSNGN